MDTTTRKTVRIDGKDVVFSATARTPRLYRQLFGKDLMQDMDKLRTAYSAKMTGGADLSAIDLTIFENIAFCMAKQADKDIPDDPDEWLEEFSIFAIYEILPQILELWHVSMGTTSEPKKK